MSSPVLYPVVPARIGTVTADATVSNNVSFSSIDSVGDSPVVPQTTRPSLPCSTSQFGETDRGVDVQFALARRTG